MSLTHHDRQRLLDFYQESYQLYGGRDARSVHWGNDTDQRRRFQVLTRVGDMNGCTVLDAGCGLGSLYKFLLEEEIEATYTGVDIVPEYIQLAKKRYPEAEFRLKDMSEVRGSFDYVLASGALTFKVSDNEVFYQGMIQHFYRLAHKAVAFNMLERGHHTDNEIYATYDPKEVADFCSTFAERVEVMVDYLPQDFSVYLYK